MSHNLLSAAVVIGTLRVKQTHRGGWGGVGWGGGTLIFSYIRRLGSFLGFKILNFNFFFWGGVGGWGSEK